MEGEKDPNITFLPLTTIREIEWLKIAEDMEYKLGDVAIWNNYLAQTTENLKTSEYEALKKAETELYGSDAARLAIAAGTVTQEL